MPKFRENTEKKNKKTVVVKIDPKCQSSNFCIARDRLGGVCGVEAKDDRRNYPASHYYCWPLEWLQGMPCCCAAAFGSTKSMKLWRACRSKIPIAQLQQQQRRRYVVVVVVVQANGGDSRHVRTAVLSIGCENCTAAQNNSRGVQQLFLLVAVVDRCGRCRLESGLSCCIVMLYMRPRPQLLPTAYPRCCIVGSDTCNDYV